MKITQHFLISGRVQGVGFRNFTQHSAQSIGLTGWVRNLKDGRVEALATGSKEKLIEFAIQLRSGPARSSVISIEIRNISPEGRQQQVVEMLQNMKEFNIEVDGEKPWSD